MSVPPVPDPVPVPEPEPAPVPAEREIEPPRDSDQQVRNVWTAYPTKSGQPRHGEIPHAEAEVIIEAIIRDGYEPVMCGTLNLRDAVERWPPGERRFIPSLTKFYSGSDPGYLADPVLWERGAATNVKSAAATALDRAFAN